MFAPTEAAQTPEDEPAAAPEDEPVPMCKWGCARSTKPWTKKCKKKSKKCLLCPECAGLLETDGDDDDDADIEPSAEDEVDENGVGICDDADLAIAFQQMGVSCKTDLLNAIADGEALTDERRCQCFLKVDLNTAADLTCKSQVWKGLTVAQEFAQCVASASASTPAVCEQSQITKAMSYMDSPCQSLLDNALVKGTPLDNSTRCGCFMQLNPKVAKAVKCKINDLQQFTLAEEYGQCVAAVSTAVADPPACTATDVQAPFDQMDSACVLMLNDAIVNNTPLTQEARCACYEQVDENVGLALPCMTMPAKKLTLAQEYQLCIAEGMGTKCTDAQLFGSAGLAQMSANCKQTLQSARGNADDPLEGIACDCYANIGAQNALGLRCKALNGSPGTIALSYQSCVAEAMLS